MRKGVKVFSCWIVSKNLFRFSLFVHTRKMVLGNNQEHFFLFFFLFFFFHPFFLFLRFSFSLVLFFRFLSNQMIWWWLWLLWSGSSFSHFFHFFVLRAFKRMQRKEEKGKNGVRNEKMKWRRRRREWKVFSFKFVTQLNLFSSTPFSSSSLRRHSSSLSSSFFDIEYEVWICVYSPSILSSILWFFILLSTRDSAIEK